LHECLRWRQCRLDNRWWWCKLQLSSVNKIRGRGQTAYRSSITVHSGLFASTLVAVAVATHLMPRPYLILLPRFLHFPPPSDDVDDDGDVCCRVPSRAHGERMGVVAGIYSPSPGSPSFAPLPPLLPAPGPSPLSFILLVLPLPLTLAARASRHLTRVCCRTR
jgi:hypothetical protein